MVNRMEELCKNCGNKLDIISVGMPNNRRYVKVYTSCVMSKFSDKIRSIRF